MVLLLLHIFYRKTSRKTLGKDPPSLRELIGFRKSLSYLVRSCFRSHWQFQWSGPLWSNAGPHWVRHPSSAALTKRQGSAECSIHTSSDSFLGRTTNATFNLELCDVICRVPYTIPDVEYIVNICQIYMMIMFNITKMLMYYRTHYITLYCVIL